jgi:hypothetical protein
MSETSEGIYIYSKWDMEKVVYEWNQEDVVHKLG